MIIIRPQAGLGNRLRALDSAVALANELNESLKIRWIKNIDLNCSLKELFEFPDNFLYSESSSKIRDNGRLEKLLLPFSKLLKKILHPNMKFYSNLDIARMKKEPEFINNISCSKNMWIQTEVSFLKNANPFYYLKPTQKIENIISGITKDYSSNTIGIHIRRSDNTVARQKSPTELFIKEIENILKDDDQSKFFLATDSLDEEAELKNHFGSSIITYKKRSYNRNTYEAIEDALVDLLCLSRTRMILGSYYSSFSEIAASFRKIPLKIIIKESIL